MLFLARCRDVPRLRVRAVRSSSRSRDLRRAARGRTGPYRDVLRHRPFIAVDGAERAVHLRRLLADSTSCRSSRRTRRASPRRGSAPLLRQHAGHRLRAAADRAASRRVAGGCRRSRSSACSGRGAWLLVPIAGAAASGAAAFLSSPSWSASSPSASASTAPCSRRSSPISRNRASWAATWRCTRSPGRSASRSGPRSAVPSSRCHRTASGSRRPPCARRRGAASRALARARALPSAVRRTPVARAPRRSRRSHRCAVVDAAHSRRHRATIENMALTNDDPLSTHAEPPSHPSDAAARRGTPVALAERRSSTSSPLAASPGSTSSRPDVETAQELAERFGWHPLDVEDIVSKRQRPKVDDYEDEGYLFAVLHFPVYDKTSSGSTRPSSTSSSGRTTSSRSRTASSCPSPASSRAARRTSSYREQLFAQGSGRLLYEMLDDLFDYCFPILDKIGHKLDADRGRDVRGPRRGGRPRHLEREAGDHLVPQDHQARALDAAACSSGASSGSCRRSSRTTSTTSSTRAERIWDLLDNYKEVVDGLESTNESVHLAPPERRAAPAHGHQRRPCSRSRSSPASSG